MSSCLASKTWVIGLKYSSHAGEASATYRSSVHFFVSKVRGPYSSSPSLEALRTTDSHFEKAIAVNCNGKGGRPKQYPNVVFSRGSTCS